MASDAILTRHFANTLKGPTFEWFSKLSQDSMHSCEDLEKLFLARFFEDESEVSIPILINTKQRDNESVKDFIERFRALALRSPGGMTQ